ncbi:hypothetical protein [Leptobacterium sp. I13]|uniref:hypothetical protein n=1 Tax=Leptobacterium meishanense TaxID=3128904 RepID=UPI0030EB907F
MSLRKKIFLTCEEANHVCDRKQYHEASFWEKIRMIIHVLYCKACMKYSMDNNKLSKLIKEANIKTLETSQKREMKESLEREMNNLGN